MTNAQDFHRELEIDVLARTIWGEARGEGDQGMTAVACVILNRVAVARSRGGRYWWGGNVIGVCQKPSQFSCWNRNDANFAKVQAVDNRDIHFATAQRIARRAVLGLVTDITMGATHYHTRDIAPYWARGNDPCVTIGRHIFYRIIE